MGIGEGRAAPACTSQSVQKQVEAEGLQVVTAWFKVGKNKTSLCICMLPNSSETGLGIFFTPLNHNAFHAGKDRLLHFFFFL